MVVKVHGPVTSACAQRVMVCLFEKGVEFDLVHVDLETGEHKKPDFLHKQPFGQVPAVEDGDFRLFESRAIIRYYAAKYADRCTDLLGTTPEERAVVDQWLEVEAHNFNDLVYTLVLHLIVFPRMGQPSDMSLAQSCKNKLGKVLDVYERRLAESRYLAGDYYSLADMSHLPGIRYLMNEVGMSHFVRERKNVNSWWEAISSRPAWKQVIKLMP